MNRSKSAIQTLAAACALTFAGMAFAVSASSEPTTRPAYADSRHSGSPFDALRGERGQGTHRATEMPALA
jgi:hypothetical protein